MTSPLLACLWIGRKERTSRNYPSLVRSNRCFLRLPRSLSCSILSRAQEGNEQTAFGSSTSFTRSQLHSSIPLHSFQLRPIMHTRSPYPLPFLPDLYTWNARSTGGKMDRKNFATLAQARWEAHMK
ncbi:hypothetical protein KFK09_016788 [Dendrobium nobile]|uniref:Uncharacterized protein n=1 Tax=Dendrobium nobile TaxID=94219 RepID=A0A8T3AZ94_DENNO|nr:hypothetical protein KFK09_016788 [Dendrobium nobile]